MVADIAPTADQLNRVLWPAATVFGLALKLVITGSGPVTVTEEVGEVGEDGM
jgi:hypothetical protein